MFCVQCSVAAVCSSGQGTPIRYRPWNCSLRRHFPVRSPGDFAFPGHAMLRIEISCNRAGHQLMVLETAHAPGQEHLPRGRDESKKYSCALDRSSCMLLFVCIFCFYTFLEMLLQIAPNSRTFFYEAYAVGTHAYWMHGARMHHVRFL